MAESPTDALQCVLPPEAEAELDEAIRLSSLSSSSSSARATPAASASASSIPAAGSLHPHSGDDGPAAGNAAYYQQSLGIRGVSRVRRGGVFCYHCSAAIPAGCLRFEYAYLKNKPPRSIHCDCLLQIPAVHVGSSLTALNAALLESGNARLPEGEAKACQGAIETLRYMQ